MSRVHAHTHELQTNRRAAQRRVRMSIPRQLVIKQDKACSTPVGAFLRGQARSSDLVLGRKKDGAALGQYWPELTTTSPGYHLPFQVITEQGRYVPCDVQTSWKIQVMFGNVLQTFGNVSKRLGNFWKHLKTSWKLVETFAPSQGSDLNTPSPSPPPPVRTVITSVQQGYKHAGNAIIDVPHTHTLHCGSRSSSTATPRASTSLNQLVQGSNVPVPGPADATHRQVIHTNAHVCGNQQPTTQ